MARPTTPMPIMTAANAMARGSERQSKIRFAPDPLLSARYEPDQEGGDRRQQKKRQRNSYQRGECAGCVTPPAGAFWPCGMRTSQPIKKASTPMTAITAIASTKSVARCSKVRPYSFSLAGLQRSCLKSVTHQRLGAFAQAFFAAAEQFAAASACSRPRGYDALSRALVPLARNWPTTSAVLPHALWSSTSKLQLSAAGFAQPADNSLNGRSRRSAPGASKDVRQWRDEAAFPQGAQPAPRHQP